MRREKES
jgi:hypothetical protein